MVKALFKSKAVIGLLITVAALVVFNLTGTGLKPHNQALFDAWYAESSAPLHHPADGSYSGKPISVTVKRFAPDNALATKEWKLPQSSLNQSDERSRMGRVLQLIAESQIFSISRANSPKSGSSYLSITVTDQERTFETTIGYDEVKDNIQLQNLLKLLEVFEMTPAAVADVPTQL